MTDKAPPRFKVGDKVISFRGEKAKVVKVRAVEHPGKSHRVQVRWESDRTDGFTPDGYRKNADSVEYYESVFEPWTEEDDA